MDASASCKSSVSRQQWLIEFRYLGNYICHISTFSISTCSCAYTQFGPKCLRLWSATRFLNCPLEETTLGNSSSTRCFCLLFCLGEWGSAHLWEPDWDSLGRLNVFGQLSPTASIVTLPPLSPCLHCPHCHPESDTHKRKAFNWVYSWVLSSPTAHDWILK